MSILKTPLEWATVNGHKEVVKFLEEQTQKKADQTEKEFVKDWAQKNNHTVVVEYLNTL